MLLFVLLLLIAATTVAGIIKKKQAERSINIRARFEEKQEELLESLRKNKPQDKEDIAS